jgi:membrane protein DedA with SNARE-associated domain
MQETIPFITHSPYLGLFILLILGTLGLPFPEDGILLLSGLLIANDIIKLIPGFFVIYPGLLITDLLLYSVGRKYGQKLVEHKKFQRMISPGRFIKLEERFTRWGALVVFFGRQLLLLRAQIFLVAGVMRMSLGKFLIVDAASALLAIALWGGLGYVGGSSIQTIRKNMINLEQMVLVILAVLIGTALLLRHFKMGRKRSGKHSLERLN